MINKEQFYANIKVQGLFSSLSQSQVDGVEAILNEWEARALTDLHWLAYIFATVYHETGKTIQPIEEIGKGKGRKYGGKVKQSGQVYTIPDKIYYGRGHTQNTWYEIYDMLTKAAAKEGKAWDFLNHPELLLQMEPSIWATFNCMTKGSYTGVALSRYFSVDYEDWVNARKIINSLDCADKIAEYGKKFYTALS